MHFSYTRYQDTAINYSHNYDCYLTLDRSKYDEQNEESLKQDKRIKSTLEELKKRTTPDYYSKVRIVQDDASKYAQKVFPTYKFIQHDALIDDWLSTVDFHKDKGTRDHSLHQTLTAYIVSEMLGQGNPTKGLILPNGNTLLAQCALQLLKEPAMKYLRDHIGTIDPDFAPYKGAYNDEWAAEVFYEAAFISALFHDMGYPWQYVNGLSRSIKGANYEEVNNTLLNTEKAAEKMSKGLLIYPFYGYNDAIVKSPSDAQKKYAFEMIDEGLIGSHGMPGAIGFSWLNEKIRFEPKKDLMKEASFRFILDWAALGIMMHDMPKLYWNQEEDKKGQVKHGILRLNCKKDPLSCIISLADILEEFERPRADFYRILDKKRNQHVALKYDFLCLGTLLDIAADRMIVTYLYATDEEAGIMSRDRGDEVKEYLGERNGYLDLTSWGIRLGEGLTRKG